MATDINEQVANAYEAAKQALNDDLKQNFYNAAQARLTAFRQINNNANANHALYSGAPSAGQMQYDASTYLPGAATAAVKAMEKQQENQEVWDGYMEYIDKINAAIAENRKYAQQKLADAKTLGGYKNIPTTNSSASYQGKSVTEKQFGDGQ